MGDQPASEHILDKELDSAEAAAQGVRDTHQTWESTQRVIALSVTGVVLFVAGAKTLYDMFFSTETGPAFIFLVGAANLVIGFYFGRTKNGTV